MGKSNSDQILGVPIWVGHFSESAIFGKGEPNQTTLTSAGDTDIFIARIK